MPPARLIGYARVSTEDQTTDPQLAALKAAGCQRVFRDVASGASRARPQLAKALEALTSGDVLVIARLDRLAGRTLTDLAFETTALAAKGHQRVLLRSSGIDLTAGTWAVVGRAAAAHLGETLLLVVGVEVGD